MDIEQIANLCSVILRILIRGRGLRVALVSSLVMGIILGLTYSRVSWVLLLLMVVPTSLTPLLIDEDIITQFFNACLIVGASPKFLNAFIALVTALYAVIYSLPYMVLIGRSYALMVLLIVSVECPLILRSYLFAVKKGIVRPGV